MRAIFALALVASLTGAAVPRVSAQSIGGMIKKKVTDKVADGTDKAADDAANMVKCLATDTACIDKAKADGKPVVIVDKNGKKAKDQSAAERPATSDSAAAPQSAAASPSEPPGSGVWLNYDFVPGERVIWAEDFSGDNVGDFPRRLQLEDGNFEVVDIKGTKYLRTTTGGTVDVILPERLPDRFTVELHYWAEASTNSVQFHTTKGGESASWGCSHDDAFADAGTGPHSSASGDPSDENAFVDCRFTIDARYIKSYLNTKRVANLPQANVVRTDSLIIEIPGYDKGTLVTGIRIAAGGKKLYDVLSAKGRVSTQGILFDTGSDRLRGESTPTLREIGDMLTQHADLKLAIEGHTDNIGSAASNQTLSEKRAAAVRQYLVDKFGIDGSRLTAQGFGASKPVAPNDTPEGRQNNRRVELVKQ